MKHYTIRVNILLEIDETIADEDRIKAKILVEKYKLHGQPVIQPKANSGKGKTGKNIIRGLHNIEATKKIEAA